MKLDRYPRQPEPQDRNGAACVELAFLLPVLLFVSLAMIEICNMITLQQMSFRVAFDTARIITQSDLANAEAIEFANQQMSELALDGHVSINVSSSAMPEFEQVTISVTTRPFNRFSFARLTRNMSATGLATAVRRTNSGSANIPTTTKKKGRGPRREIN